MNVVVCVKEVPDINLPLAIDFDRGFVNAEDTIPIVNPCDRSAVEEAIAIKERKGKGKVTLLSLGPTRAVRSLRKCLAMGADEAVLIDQGSMSDLDSHGISNVIASALRTLKYDLLLCGGKARDMQLGGGQSGPRIATLLGLPFVTEVDLIEISDDDRKSKVHQRLEKGNKNIIECPLPALFTISENANQPRYPTFTSSLHAIRCKVDIVTIESFGLSYSDLRPLTKVMQVIRPKPRQKKIFTPDVKLSAEDRIKAMLGGGAKEKKSEFLEGNPDWLAENIVKFLNSTRHE